MRTAFQGSNLSIESATNEAWRVLARQLNPSRGSGSGNLSSTGSNLGVDAKWLRRFELIVYGAASPQTGGTGPVTQGAIPTTQGGSAGASGGNSSFGSQKPGIDLSALRCTFHIDKSTNRTPNTLYVRIYNMAPATMATVIEMGRVQISAGHKFSAYGVIFDGTVVQYVRGKENPTDTFLDIYAGDGDRAINSAVMFERIDKGSTDYDRYQKALDVKKKAQADLNEAQNDTSVSDEQKQKNLLRAHIMVGRADDEMRTLAQAYKYDEFIDQGKLNIVRRNGFKPGEELVLSPQTGLIGIPEVTPQGIQIRCLLDPRIRLGGVVRISSDLLSGVAYAPGTKMAVDSKGNFVPGAAAGGVITRSATWEQPLVVPFTAPEGRYKILMMKLSGDTRGLEWYCDLACLALGSDGKVMATPGSVLQRAGPETGVVASGEGPATNIPAPASSLTPQRPARRRAA